MKAFVSCAVACLVPYTAVAHRTMDHEDTLHMALSSKATASAITEDLSNAPLQPCTCSLPGSCSERLNGEIDYSTCYCDGGCHSGFCKYVAKGSVIIAHRDHWNDESHWNGYCQDRGRELNHRCESDGQCAQGICDGRTCRGCYDLHDSETCGRAEGCVWAGDGPSEKCRLDCNLIWSEGACKAVANPLRGADYCEWNNNACTPKCAAVSRHQNVHGSCPDLTLGKCVDGGTFDCQDRVQLRKNGLACDEDSQCRSGICLDAGYDLKTKKKTQRRKLELLLFNTARVGLALAIASLPQFVPPMIVFKIFKTPQEKRQCRQLPFDPLEPLLHDPSKMSCNFYSMIETDVFCAEREMDEETEEAKACTTSVSAIKQRFDLLQGVMSDASDELSSLQSWLDEAENGPQAINSANSNAHLLLEGTDPVGWTEVIVDKVTKLRELKQNEEQKPAKTQKILKFPSAYDAWYVHNVLNTHTSKVQYQLQCFDFKEYLQVKAGQHPKYRPCKLPCETKNASDAYRLMNTASIDKQRYVEFLPNKANFGNFAFESLNFAANWCEATLQDCEVKKHSITEWWACVGDKAYHAPKSNVPYFFADPWTNPRCGLMDRSL
mmetsp:Transcript_46511/g.92426  ORF Transcript_46511/g.92426 Transcript_46511/m.92426 type:complete len:607 (-) Transcript_46511:77-1897(-)